MDLITDQLIMNYLNLSERSKRVGKMNCFFVINHSFISKFFIMSLYMPIIF